MMKTLLLVFLIVLTQLLSGCGIPNRIRRVHDRHVLRRPLQSYEKVENGAFPIEVGMGDLTSWSAIHNIAVISEGAFNQKAPLETAVEQALLNKGFTVASRSQIDKAVKEISHQNSQLASPYDAAQLGRMLNAQALLIISVNAAASENTYYEWESILAGKHSDFIGTRLTMDISLRLLAVEKSQTVWVGSQSVSGLFKSVPPLDQVCSITVRRIIARMPPRGTVSRMSIRSE